MDLTSYGHCSTHLVGEGETTADLAQHAAKRL